MTRIDELRGLMGPERVSASGDDLDAHSLDWTPETLLRRRSGGSVPRPLCVVRPASTAEVAALLAWAQDTRTPVVCFGGGFGVVGGIVTSPDAIVLDTGGLDSVKDLDEYSGLVTVGAGVTGPRLRDELGVRGLTLGHEPQSLELSTVGGWIATRACGQLSARYGGIEDLVAGLEAVLPGGRIVRSKIAPRRSTGPDLAALMIGSEGALGIVTEATLRTRPSPQGRSDFCVVFEHMSDGVAACHDVARSDLQPTMVRLYDEEDALIFLRSFDDPPAGPLLLMSFQGERSTSRRDAAAALCRGRATDARFVEHWWRHRNDAVGEFRSIMEGRGSLGEHGLVETIEVAGTWSGLRGLYHSIKDALRPHTDLVGCHLSHVYPDGACLYFTVAAVCSDEDDARARLQRWWAQAMSACLEAGGTISHHHGIGRTRAAWLRAELGETFEMLREVKSALDPHGIMNPGALGL